MVVCGGVVAQLTNTCEGVGVVNGGTKKVRCREKEKETNEFRYASSIILAMALTLVKIVAQG